jgi:hypothetical protein
MSRRLKCWHLEQQSHVWRGSAPRRGVSPPEQGGVRPAVSGTATAGLCTLGRGAVMAREIRKKDELAPETTAGVKRRGLLRFGTLITAFTGASAISALAAESAHAGPGDKNPPTSYVPIAEKGVASGVATLDLESKIPPAQLPDLSASYATTAAVSSKVAKGDLLLNVRDFGAKLDGVTDDTAAIQQAMNTANASGGEVSIVFIPKGTAIISSLTVPEKVTLRGSGKSSTVLQVMSGGTAPGALNIAAGYSDNIFFEDFQLRGAGGLNPGQHGLYANATGDGKVPDTGGWGNGGARRILIQNFTGHQLWLRGKGQGAGQYYQHQFLTFELCDFSARDLAHAMLMSGKVGQVTFTNCQFSYGGGSSTQAGTNLRIVREVADDGVTNTGTGSAYAITFVNCSVEGRAQGAIIERAESVAFFNTFFERLGKAFRADTATRNIVLYGTHFADAGVDGAGTGYLVMGASANNVTLFGVNIVGKADRSFIDFVQVHGVVGATVPTQNMTVNTDPSAGVLDVQSAATATTRGTVHTIPTKFHLPGNVVYVRAWGGSVTFTSGGNLSYNGRAVPLTVPDGGVATFVRFDQGSSAAWSLVGVSALSTAVTARTLTASTTLGPGDEFAVMNGTDLTITLPDPTTVGVGTTYGVKNIHPTPVTVVSAGTGKTIDAAASQSLAQWAIGGYMSDGVRWLNI